MSAWEAAAQRASAIRQAVTYSGPYAADSVPSHGAPEPVKPTADVQKATAEFMAAWNKAAARATKIQTILVKSGTPGHYTFQAPQQVQATQEVQRATAEFMAAWNEAARRATTVQHAMYALPQPVQPTAEVQRATEEF